MGLFTFGLFGLITGLAFIVLRDNARLRDQLVLLESVDPTEDKTGAAAILDDRSYEIGHRDGENSANADWGIALDEILPVGVSGWSLDEVVAYILKLQGDILKMQGDTRG